jgi:hypothetical protein
MGRISYRHKICWSPTERKWEICVCTPWCTSVFLLGITSEAFSITVALHPRKRTKRIFQATAKPVNTIRPHCWMCRKIQPTSGHSLPYCSKRLLRPPFKPGPVPKTHFQHEEVIAEFFLPMIRNTDIYFSAKKRRRVANDGTFVSYGPMEIRPLLLDYA